MFKRQFGIQWHVTTRCDQRCVHCYMFDSDYFPVENRDELNFEGMRDILFNFLEAANVLECVPHISFTGGDPLLKPGFFKILEEIKKLKESGQEFSLRMMGNPYHLNNEVAKDLFKFGILYYQLSIDGLKDTHDAFRKMGSFQNSLKAISILKENGIKPMIMFSLSKKNFRDIFPLMKLMVDVGVQAFTFARIVANGRGRDRFKKEEEQFTPEEYKDFLREYFELKQELIKKGVKTKFPEKDHLWSLFHYERGELQTKNDNIVYSGCSMGVNCPSVLADGTVYACRRFPSPVGKLPEEKLIDVFLNDKFCDYRDVNKLEKCRRCELLNYCRGCPAVAWGLSGSHLSKDPQCWKVVPDL